MNFQWLFDRPIAHRGLHDEQYPENSMPAYEQAIAHNFNIEIDVPGRVYKVENVFFALVGIIKPARLKFYGYSALFFDFHIVEKLLGHFARGNSTRLFDEAVGKRTLAVVDVRDYGKIAYVFFAQSVLSHQNFAIKQKF